MMDLQLEILDLYTVARARQSIKRGRDQAADRRRMGLVGKRSERIAELTDTRIAIDDPSAWSKQSWWIGYLQCRFRDVSDEFLDDVLQGDHPRCTAVFIHDDGEDEAILPEDVQSQLEGSDFRDEPGGDHQVGDLLLLIAFEPTLDRQDTENVVEILAVNRKSAHAVFLDQGSNLLRFVVDLDRDGLRPGRHGLPNGHVAQLDHIQKRLVLLAIHHSRVGGMDQKPLEFIRGEGVVSLSAAGESADGRDDRGIDDHPDRTDGSVYDEKYGGDEGGEPGRFGRGDHLRSDLADENDHEQRSDSQGELDEPVRGCPHHQG